MSRFTKGLESGVECGTTCVVSRSQISCQFRAEKWSKHFSRYSWKTKIHRPSRKDFLSLPSILQTNYVFGVGGQKASRKAQSITNIACASLRKIETTRQIWFVHENIVRLGSVKSLSTTGSISFIGFLPSVATPRHQILSSGDLSPAVRNLNTRNEAGDCSPEHTASTGLGGRFGNTAHRMSATICAPHSDEWKLGSSYTQVTADPWATEDA